MKDEALKLALEALEYASTGNRRPEIIGPAITAIKEALAAPAQEPRARLMRYIGKGTYPEQGYTVARTYEELSKNTYPDTWEEGEALYTTPPAAQRKPLGEHEIVKILDRERMKWIKSPPTYEFDLAFVRAIEAAHGIKEKNT